MIKRLNELGFIIGLFFILLAIILLAGYFTTVQLKTSMNLYSGISFLVFGLLMLMVKDEGKEDR